MRRLIATAVVLLAFAGCTSSEDMSAACDSHGGLSEVLEGKELHNPEDGPYVACNDGTVQKP